MRDRECGTNRAGIVVVGPLGFEREPRGKLGEVAPSHHRDGLDGTHQHRAHGVLDPAVLRIALDAPVTIARGQRLGVDRGVEPDRRRELDTLDRPPAVVQIDHAAASPQRDGERSREVLEPTIPDAASWQLRADLDPDPRRVVVVESQHDPLRCVLEEPSVRVAHALGPPELRAHRADIDQRARHQHLRRIATRYPHHARQPRREVRGQRRRTGVDEATPRVRDRAGLAERVAKHRDPRQRTEPQIGDPLEPAGPSDHRGDQLDRGGARALVDAGFSSRGELGDQLARQRGRALFGGRDRRHVAPHLGTRGVGRHPRRVDEQSQWRCGTHATVVVIVSLVVARAIDRRQRDRIAREHHAALGDLEHRALERARTGDPIDDRDEPFELVAELAPCEIGIVLVAVVTRARDLEWHRDVAAREPRDPELRRLAIPEHVGQHRQREPASQVHEHPGRGCGPRRRPGLGGLEGTQRRLLGRLPRLGLGEDTRRVPRAKRALADRVDVDERRAHAERAVDGGREQPQVIARVGGLGTDQLVEQSRQLVGRPRLALPRKPHVVGVAR